MLFVHLAIFYQMPNFVKILLYAVIIISKEDSLSFDPNVKKLYDRELLNTDSTLMDIYAPHWGLRTRNIQTKENINLESGVFQFQVAPITYLWRIDLSVPMPLVNHLLSKNFKFYCMLIRGHWELP